MATNLNVTGNLTVTGGGANLTTNGNTVTVTGDFDTQSSGVLTMTNGADVLDVVGDVTFRGGSTAGLLSAGELRLQGNFIQLTGSFQSFQPSGTHNVLFNGTAAQTISFSTPSATNSLFQGLEITNSSGSGVSLNSNAWVNGNLTVTSAILTGLTLDGTLSVTGAYSVTNTILNGSGPLTIPALAYTNLDVTGTAQFAASSTQNISGNLKITGTGSLKSNASTVTVTGDFQTLNTAVYEMSCVSDLLTVQGDIVFGGGDAAGLLSAGTINVKGDFTQSGDVESFHAGSSHTVDFNGTAAQTLTFTNPGIGIGAEVSHFTHVAFNNTSAGGVTLGSDVYAHSDLRSTAGASKALIKGGGRNLKVGGLNVSALRLERVLLEWNGTATFPSFGSFTNFTNVGFDNYLGTDTQMTVEHPRAASPYSFSTITLLTLPTTGGFYLLARDSDAISPFLTMGITSSPANCGELFESEVAGGVVNWNNC